MPPPPPRRPNEHEKGGAGDNPYWGGNNSFSSSSAMSFNPHPPESSQNAASTPLENASKLSQRLKMVGATQQPLSVEAVKDYIAYARRYVHPRLKREAGEVLRSYYLNLKHKVTADGLPITTRQLEAMIRLAQARAKACLREWVTKDDAEDVIDLMSMSIIQTLSDGGGNLDSSRRGSHGTSKMGKKRKLLDMLKGLLNNGHPNGFTFEEIMDMKDALDCTVFSLRDMLDELREQSTLVKKVDDGGTTIWKVAAQ